MTTTVIGNLVADPELRKDKKGNPYYYLKVAQNFGKIDKNRRTTWVHVHFYGDESQVNTLSKSQGVSITGAPFTYKKDDKGQLVQDHEGNPISIMSPAFMVEKHFFRRK